MMNVNVSVKNVRVYENDYFRNPAKCSCENGKYLASIMDDIPIMCLIKL